MQLNESNAFAPKHASALIHIAFGIGEGIGPNAHAPPTTPPLLYYAPLVDFDPANSPLNTKLEDNRDQ